MSRTAARSGWIAALLIGAVAGAAGGWGWFRQATLLDRLAGQLSQADRPTKLRALRLLRRQSGPRAQALLARALTDPDRRVRIAASHAIYRARARRAAQALEQAIAAESDGRARYRMIVDWSELVGPSGSEQLQRWQRSGDAWSALGSAVARLWRGQVQAAETLFATASSPNRRLRAAASRELRRLCLPLMEMIGSRVAISGRMNDPISRAELLALRRWWRRHVSPVVLADMLGWYRQPPTCVRLIGKLLRAQQRANRWLGLH